MKARAESLRSAREKERQIIANEKLHEHWIANDPDLRSIEQQKLENRQPEYWSEQVNQKRLVQQEEEDENLKYQQEVQERLDQQMRFEREEQDERKRRIDELKYILQEQMEELKQKDEEVKFLSALESHSRILFVNNTFNTKDI